MTVINRLFPEQLGGDNDIDAFIGRKGEIFYDAVNGSLRLSDGSTPGGVPLTGAGSSGSFDPTLYYTKAAVDGKFTAMVGSATVIADTLGELEGLIAQAAANSLPLSGGTVTGPIKVSIAPAAPDDLVNKAYVDSLASSGNYLSTTGGTVTGAIDSAVVPTANTNLTNKLYVDNAIFSAKATLTTDDVAEGTNLYYTDTRVKAALANTTNTNGLVRSVNGVYPDANGAVPISLTATITGDLASRPAATENGILYVVSGDANTELNGDAYIWTGNTTVGTWESIAPADTAVNDARYVNVGGDTMTGSLILSGDPASALGAATKQYVDAAANSISLDKLTDVSSANAVAGQALVFNGTEWVAATPASTLDSLTDVVSASATAGQSLVFNGTNWVPATPAAKLGDLTDVSNTAPGTGYVLGWDSANNEWKPIASSAAPTLAGLLDVDVTGYANNSTLLYSNTVSKWVATTPQPKKTTMLPDHGISWGRAHVYGNEVFCAGFSGTERIHSWDHAGDVVTSLSAPFEIRPPGIAKLVDGMSYQHVLGTDGILYSRGRDSEGQMGTGGSPGRPVDDRGSIFKQNRDPKIYGPGITVTNVWSHRKHHWDGWDGGPLYVEVDDNGTKKFYAAGYNGYGQLGIGGATNTNSLTELPLLSGKGIKKLDNVSHIMMLVTENGELWGAGYNFNGALGIDFIGQSSLSRSKYADGSFVTGAVDVQVSWVNSVGTQSWFLRNDGTVWGSGSNGEGNLCNGSTGDVTKFKQVLTAANTPITGVVKIKEVGRGQLFMLKSDGTVWATGRNHDGCFGNSAFPTYTSIGNFAKQIQSDIQDFWSFGGEIAGWCQVFWKKNNKMFFSGTNFNYTGGSFTEALGANYYNFLQPIESLDSKTVIDVKPINKINSDGSGTYRNTMFLTDAGEIYLAGRNDWCHVPDDGDAIYFKTTYKLRDYLEGGSENVYISQTQMTPTNINDLSDVSAASPTTGDALVWDGVQWSPSAVAAGSSSVAAEFGEALLPSNVILNNNNVVSLLTVNIPSAGTWEIEYSLNVGNDGSSSNDGGSFWLADVNGAEVVGSGQSTYSTDAANQLYGLNRTVIVTTTGATTYTVRGQRFNNTAQVSVFGGASVSTQVGYIGRGSSKVVWKKISGFLPMTGTAHYHSSVLSTTLVGGGNVAQDMTNASSVVGNIPFSNGIWTLTAGVTYDLSSSLIYDAGANGPQVADTAVMFVDATNNVALPNQTGSLIITSAFTTRGIARNGVNRFTYTPTTNQTIKLRVTYQSSPGNLSAQAYVSQIGSFTVTNNGATALSGLTDTAIVSPEAGSRLQWNGTKWTAVKDAAAITGSAPLYYEAGLGDTQEALTSLGFTLSGEAVKQQNVAGNFNSAGIRLIDTVGAGGNGTVAWNPGIDWTKNVRVSFRMFIPNAGTVDDIIVGMAGNLDKTQSIEMSIDPYTSSYKVRRNGVNLTTVTWTNSPAGSPANAWSRFFAEITTVNGKRILKLVRWVGGEPQIAAAGDVTGFGTAFGGLYFYAWNGAAIPSSAVLLQSCQVEYI